MQSSKVTTLIFNGAVQSKSKPYVRSILVSNAHKHTKVIPSSEKAAQSASVGPDGLRHLPLKLPCMIEAA